MNNLESIKKKLESLGVQLGAGELKPQPVKSNYSIEAMLPKGYDDLTPFGNTFVVCRHYPLGYQHGSTILKKPLDPSILNRWGKLSTQDPSGICNYLFLDTETSGLSGGVGVFPFLIGLGCFAQDGFRLTQLFIRNPQDEPAMLVTLNRIVESFDVIVTFNGKSFDIPILNTRHTLHGFTSPFLQYEHIDILHLSRRIWRNRLDNRSLGSLEMEIMHVERGQEEIPGWMVPQIYFDYLQIGDARPLAGVFYHNAMDILSLAALFNHISDMLNQPSMALIPHALDRIAIGQIFEEMELYQQATQSYESSLNQGLPVPFFISTLLRFANLSRRQGSWISAIGHWEKAAEYGSIDACIELSKYYEHQQKDFEKSKHWAVEGSKIIASYPRPGYKYKRILAEIQHRLERIESKSQKRNLRKQE